MSNNKDLLKEAIADAKIVKETAIENAKAALEEAFTPFLKEKLAAKLAEMDNEEANEEAVYESEDSDLEEMYMEEEPSMNEGSEEESEEMNEEFSLDELLAELEEGEESISEAKEESEEGESEGESEELDLENMTEDDLKEIIEDVIKDMKASGELEDETGSEESEEMEAPEMEASEEEVEIDEELFENEEIQEGTFGPGMADMSTIDAIISMLGAAGLVTGVALASFKKEIKDYFSKTGKKEIPTSEIGKMIKKAKSGKMDEMKKSDDVEEALKTIQTLREELNEINLLNAKLLYTNKIFRNKNLSENQKIKVLASFDKAKTKNEAKLVYETLVEEIKTPSINKASTIKESLGFASKAMGTAPKADLIIENKAFERMQKLAGIKK